MQTATYPAKKCREPVWSDMGQAYPCELAVLHTGPCASLSVATSIRRRDTWEAEHPEQVGQSVDGGDIIL